MKLYSLRFKTPKPAVPMVVEISWTKEWYAIYKVLLIDLSATCEGFCY